MPPIVARVTDVQPHPKSDSLDVVTIGTVTNVANRPSPNTPRYKVGDYAVILHDNLILPEWLLKHLDMWNHEKDKGGLAGSKGNRTKGRMIGKAEDFPGIYSVALYGCIYDQSSISMELEDGTYVFVTEGQEVQEDLGITEYVPPTQ